MTIALVPDGDATLLMLHHTGIRGSAPAVAFGGGWGAHLAVLERRIAGQPVRDFWALREAAEPAAAAAAAAAIS